MRGLEGNWLFILVHHQENKPLLSDTQRVLLHRELSLKTTQDGFREGQRT